MVRHLVADSRPLLLLALPAGVDCRFQGTFPGSKLTIARLAEPPESEANLSLTITGRNLATALLKIQWVFTMGLQRMQEGLSWSGTATRLGAKAKDSPLQPPAKKLPDIRGSHRIRSIFQNFLARGQIFSWIPILDFARSSSGAGGKGAGEESANAPGNRLR